MRYLMQKNAERERSQREALAEREAAAAAAAAADDESDSDDIGDDADEPDEAGAGDDGDVIDVFARVMADLNNAGRETGGGASRTTKKTKGGPGSKPQACRGCKLSGHNKSTCHLHLHEQDYEETGVKISDGPEALELLAEMGFPAEGLVGMDYGQWSAGPGTGTVVPTARAVTGSNTSAESAPAGHGGINTGLNVEVLQPLALSLIGKDGARRSIRKLAGNLLILYRKALQAERNLPEPPEESNVTSMQRYLRSVCNEYARDSGWTLREGLAAAAGSSDAGGEGGDADGGDGGDDDDFDDVVVSFHDFFARPSVSVFYSETMQLVNKGVLLEPARHLFGLKNLGATCYLNAAFQMLLSSALGAFIAFVFEKFPFALEDDLPEGAASLASCSRCFFCCVCDFVLAGMQPWNAPAPALPMDSLFRSFFGDTANPGRQEDARLCFVGLIELLKRDLANGHDRGGGGDFLQGLFGFDVSSVPCCSTCHELADESPQTGEILWDIPLAMDMCRPVHDDVGGGGENISLLGLLRTQYGDGHRHLDRLGPNEASNRLCLKSSCESFMMNLDSRSISVEHIPRDLIFSLGRARTVNSPALNGGMRITFFKVDAIVEFPQIVAPSEAALQALEGSDTNKTAMLLPFGQRWHGDEDLIVWELQSVIEHQGPTISSGHYVCYVSNSGIVSSASPNASQMESEPSSEWWLMNDKKKLARTWEQVRHVQAFMLCYVMRPAKIPSRQPANADAGIDDVDGMIELEPMMHIRSFRRYLSPGVFGIVEKAAFAVPPGLQLGALAKERVRELESTGSKRPRSGDESGLVNDQEELDELIALLEAPEPEDMMERTRRLTLDEVTALVSESLASFVPEKEYEGLISEIQAGFIVSSDVNDGMTEGITLIVKLIELLRANGREADAERMYTGWRRVAESPKFMLELRHMGSLMIINHQSEAHDVSRAETRRTPENQPISGRCSLCHRQGGRYLRCVQCQYTVHRNCHVGSTNEPWVCNDCKRPKKGTKRARAKQRNSIYTYSSNSSSDSE